MCFRDRDRDRDKNNMDCGNEKHWGLAGRFPMSLTFRGRIRARYTPEQITAWKAPPVQA